MSTIPISEIIIDEEEYPRDHIDNQTVELYSLSLDSLPPIKLRKNKHLVDGRHRILAHKLRKVEEIKFVYDGDGSKEILFQAIVNNSRHGKSLTRREKQHCAIKLRKGGWDQRVIAGALSVSQTTISLWLKDTETIRRIETRQKVTDLFLGNKSERDIAKKIKKSPSTTHQLLGNIRSNITHEMPSRPDNLQVFNVWNFPVRDPLLGLSHPGMIPGQIMEHLMHYFTEPFDLVVDPMAGGGSTIDACKKWSRKYLAYDLEPKRDDITQNDVTKRYPIECQYAKLFFLDPPYFDMVFKHLFKSLSGYRSFIHLLARNTQDIMRKGSICAVLMEDFTEKELVLSGEIFCTFAKTGLTPIYSVSIPQPRQLNSPQVLKKMQEEKKMMGMSRILWIFRRD